MPDVTLPRNADTLCRMGRRKTISDDDVLGFARDLFRRKGHSATTREIADAAGISEAILYQRFGSKDDLFLAAMHPRGPDLDKLLGPVDPRAGARAYLRAAILRVGRYFAEIIPQALHVMTHPSFGPRALDRFQPAPGVMLQQGLAERLASLARRREIHMRSATATARLLISVAHDWALAGALRHEQSSRRERELKEMVDVIWRGLRK